MARMPAPNLSFEFFPPKTPEGAEKLRSARAALAALGPAYFSVTFGAGGSTREGTYETVMESRSATGVETAPHLSCIASSKADIAALLERYRAAGIRRLVALRGDMPSGSYGVGDLRHANELVGFIRDTTGDHFHIEVAAYPEVHPQAEDARADLRHFIGKMRAGADGAITQYFYNADAYFRFVEDCAALGLAAPITPGVMPITNYTQLARFSDACGAEIPRWLRKRLAAFGDDVAALKSFGEEVVTRLCERLLQGGAPGLHFYTLNGSQATLAICRNLGLPASH
jgi:methylenetetrahydrofolate reductase (NADPH)